jgi:hypothetical protein
MKCPINSLRMSYRLFVPVASSACFPTSSIPHGAVTQFGWPGFQSQSASLGCHQSLGKIASFRWWHLVTSLTHPPTQHYILLQRNLIYTGITRGKRLLVLIGQKKALGIAIRNDRPQRRYSGLLASLKGKRGTEGSAFEPKTASQSRMVS